MCDTLSVSRVDEIAIRALGLNGPYAGRIKVWDALEIVATAIESDGAWRSLIVTGKQNVNK